jgi:hypothetical protein
MDDAGELRLDDLTSYDWSANDMWGYCASKPRLPGVGFDYSEAAMEEAAARRPPVSLGPAGDCPCRD